MSGICPGQVESEAELKGASVEKVEWTEMRAVEDSAEGGRAAAGGKWEAASATVEQARECLERSVGRYNDAVEELERVLGGWARESWDKLEVPDEDEDADEIDGLAGDLPDLSDMIEEIGRVRERVDRAGSAVEADAGALADAVRGRERLVEDVVEAVLARVEQIRQYVGQVEESPSGEGLERLGNLERALDAVLRLV